MEAHNHIPNNGVELTNMDDILLEPCCVDRLKNLPDELLSLILSMLSTKEAGAMQVVSKGMRQAFSSITSIDLDDSPVSLCPNDPHLVERSPLFESFVDNILHKLSESGQPLTRFKLHLGGEKANHFHFLDSNDDCKETVACFSDLDPDRLYKWISYPLFHYSLKEVDISFHVMNPFSIELPSGIFTCPSLEVLKLDSNLKIDNDEIPLIRLPNLKRLYLSSIVFSEDDFITRLVSNCPVLDVLSILYCFWEILDHVTISSHSLRSLVFHIDKRDHDKQENSNLVFIDTPRLQYLDYDDYLACTYSITHTNALVKARIYNWNQLDRDSEDTTDFQNHLSLMRAVSNVHHLSLRGYCVVNVYFLGASLPVFRNLRTLELDAFNNERWDKVVLLILHSTPSLENLEFTEGLCVDVNGNYVSPTWSIDYRRVAKAEAKGWRTNETIPSCFRSHLKRIAIASFYATRREFNMIKFFLREASVLKELDICLGEGRINAHLLPEILKCVPTASNSCSIIAK